MFEELDFTKEELIKMQESLKIQQRDLDIQKAFVRVLLKKFDK